MRFDARAGMRIVAGIHEFWYRMTDGLIGGNFLGTPMLLLTTTGRKTGKRYTTPLVYLEDGEDLVVIASNGGSNRHPQWLLNLKAHPEADVQAGTKRSTVRAEAATGEERARLWEKVTSRYGFYKRYQMRTAREIPVVKLHRQPFATARVTEEDDS
jgi:deazaflavin-dependent oxidoreductase (nitroreductase family)